VATENWEGECLAVTPVERPRRHADDRAKSLHISPADYYLI
jgi:hypothetical protein